MQERSSSNDAAAIRLNQPAQSGCARVPQCACRLNKQISSDELWDRTHDAISDLFNHDCTRVAAPAKATSAIKSEGNLLLIAVPSPPERPQLRNITCGKKTVRLKKLEAKAKPLLQCGQQHGCCYWCNVLLTASTNFTPCAAYFKVLCMHVLSIQRQA
eukprot:15926-Heterococcus_DN1.PRE.1